MIKISFKKTIFFIMSVIVLLAFTSIIINAIRGNPIEPVSKVIIESNNYDNPGSYHIEKSAKWLDNDSAEITFNVDTIPITDGKYKDVVMVIDMSGSMEGYRLNTLKKNAKELVDVLLNDSHNSVSLITFDTTSEILSGFTKNKELIINEIDDLNYRGATNYNAALNNVIEVLDGYEKKDNTDLVVLFLTDGYPNEDTPNQIATYQILKNMYPYLTVHGVQYEMGNQVVGDVRNISDQQWIADINTLHNVLFDAILSPLKYEKFEVVDYIDKDYFYINSINDIDVSMGNVSIKDKDGYQKVIWNLDNFYTGNNTSMKIKIKLKDEYTSVKGLYPTNDREIINYKIVDNEEKEDESDKTPVLKNYYNVIYDTNTPTGCTLDNIDNEEHIVFTNVTKKQDKLTCSGYLFKEWKIEDNDVVRVNDDTFIMPEHDVTIKAIWSKVDISKSMDGKIYEKTTLYKAVENEAINGKGVNLYSYETDDGGGSNNVYYYTGQSVKNNVLFGDYCWQIIRTTDTGGVKMIYNGRPDESGKCGDDRGSNNVGFEAEKTLTLNGNYNYGTNYQYNSQTNLFELTGDITNEKWNDSTYENLIGKYTCGNANNSCSKLYYVESYNSNNSAFVLPYNSTTHYSIIGSSKFNNYNNSLSYAGYMYNTVYQSKNMNISFSYSMLYKRTLNTEYYYSDSYTIENGKYKLNNPQRIESIDNYSNMVGMYTFFDSYNKNYELEYLYYITNVDKDTVYYLKLSNGQELDDANQTYSFGDEIIDNHDGTYTISGNIKTFKKNKWLDNYSSLINNYTCNSNNLICENPYYIVSFSDYYKEDYTYVNVANNYKYGNTFEYDSETGLYTLKDTVQFYDYGANKDLIVNHHYTCFNTSGQCSNLSYIYLNYTNYSPNFIELKNGKNVADAVKEMLSNDDINSINSNIKNMIDFWFENNLNNYVDYLEDTVFCNNRVLSGSGWTTNSKLLTIYFHNPNEGEIICPINIDKFTVSNNIGNGALKYPVGLISRQERFLVKNASYSKINFWTMSPGKFEEGVVYMNYSNSNAYSRVNVSNGVRPVISLKPNIEYTEGDGSTDKPFVVPTE